MKPVRNLYFCPDCGKTKMLFPTDKKAENFIRFNAEEIAAQNEDGKAPVRVYYCVACGGWHTTSRWALPKYESRTERLLIRLGKDGSLVHDALCRKLLRLEAETEQKNAKKKKKLDKEKTQRLLQEQQAQAALAAAHTAYLSAMHHFDRVDDYINQCNIAEASRELANGIVILNGILYPGLKSLCSEKTTLAYRKLEALLDTYYDCIVDQINSQSWSVAEPHIKDYKRAISLLERRNENVLRTIAADHWLYCKALLKSLPGQAG